jgi:Flp pilus assembly protein TadD
MPQATLRAAPLVLMAAVGFPLPATAILEEPPIDAPAPAAALCVGGTIWYAEGATCVDPALGLVDDDRLYAEVRRHAYAGRYAEAARLLSSMRETGTARVLTAEGFILRRTGRVAEGLARYAEALSIDPRHHMARAYWGLWHLEQGDRDGAEAMLEDIIAEGGAGGEAWRMLSEALAGAADD